MSDEIIKKENTAVTSQNEESLSVRFVNKIVKNCQDMFGDLLEIPDTQKRLAQNYYIAIDRQLEALEQKRQQDNQNKDEKYQNKLPYTWKNILFNDLMQDVLHYSKIGLDPLSRNHISFIPFKVRGGTVYRLNPIVGYVGQQLKAIKYALEAPSSTTVEVVYSTDTFKVVKASAEVPYDRYEFSINNPFDRGEVIGAFAYHRYNNDTLKNKLLFLSLDEVRKRTKNKNIEFWGGEKTVKKWVDGKAVETKEEVEGWKEQMVYKAMVREAFSEKWILIDPSKIDQAYFYTKARDIEMAKIEATAEISDNNASGETINIDIPAIQTDTTSMAATQGDVEVATEQKPKRGRPSKSKTVDTEVIQTEEVVDTEHTTNANFLDLMENYN